MPYIRVAIFLFFTCLGGVSAQSFLRTGTEGASKLAAREVMAFVRRSEGTMDVSTTAGIISDLKAHLLVCININGVCEVRELAVVQPDTDGSFHVKKQGKDYELASAGTFTEEGGDILFDGNCYFTLTLGPDKAPPAGQKPKIQMGRIHTFLLPGKPIYIAGLQAAEVMAPSGETTSSGVEVDMFLYVR